MKNLCGSIFGKPSINHAASFIDRGIVHANLRGQRLDNDATRSMCVAPATKARAADDSLARPSATAARLPCAVRRPVFRCAYGQSGKHLKRLPALGADCGCRMS